MAHRIIKTVDDQTFSDRSSKFEDHKGYVLYKISLFKTIRINRRSITTDDVSGIPASVLILGLFALIVILALVPYLVMERDGDTDKGRRQDNVNFPVPASLPVVGDGKSNQYYLPECPGYESVGAYNKVTFSSEQQAIAYGFRKAESCSRKPIQRMR